MRRLALLALPAFGISVASAADLPLKAPPSAAPPVAVYNWTGLYIGGQVGGAWSHQQNDTTSPLVEVISHDGSTWVAGGQIGYDYQFAPQALVGVEGSLSGMKLAVDWPSVVNPPSHYFTRNDWLATVTGRLGYVAGPWLVYARGGYAAANPEFIGTTTGDSLNVGGTRNGWTVGGGLEYLIQRNFSLALEYNHYDFGTKHYDGLTNTQALPVHADVAFSLDSLMLRANFRFGS